MATRIDGIAVPSGTSEEPLEIIVAKGYYLIISPIHGQLVAKPGTTPAPETMNKYLAERPLGIYCYLLGLERTGKVQVEVIVNGNKVYLTEGTGFRPINLVNAVAEEAQKSPSRVEVLLPDYTLNYWMVQERNLRTRFFETGRYLLEEALPDMLQQIGRPVKKRSNIEIRLPNILDPETACMEFLVAYQF